MHTTVNMHVDDIPVLEFIQFKDSTWFKVFDSECDSTIAIFVENEHADRLKRACEAFNDAMREPAQIEREAAE